MRLAIRFSWCRHAVGLALAAILVPFAAGPRSARADLLFFKDGFAIEGKVKREMTLEFDKVGGEMYHMPRGFMFLDDGPRRIFFPPTQVRYVYAKDPALEERVVSKDQRLQVNPRKLPPLLEVTKAPQWGLDWNRRFEFRGPNGPVRAPQHISLLTPYWARVDSLGSYFWACAYLTRELGPDTVRMLLNAHPDFREKKGETTAAQASRRLRKCDFYAQAGWYQFAEEELDRLLRDLPDQKSRVEAARTVLAKLRARDLFEEIKRLHLAGQHKKVRRKMADFPSRDVPEKLAADLDELRAEYDTTAKALAETSRLLDKARQAVEGPEAKVLAEAAAALRADLEFENVGRLEAFLGQARQAERFVKKGKKPEVSPAELLSLAVSGWLLGSASAETSRETAVRLWHGRQMVLKYLRSDDSGERDALVKAHLKMSRREAASLDELMQIIPNLPPVEPAEKVAVAAAGGAGAAGKEDDTGRRGPYRIQLPPEYRNSRAYPVLIVLHQAGEKPKEMLDRWKDAAAENGYILVAPEWEQNGLGSGYTYSEREHAVVLDTLRNLRRRYWVDSDRVFLFGLGEGGAMAFDVGLAHPDLFAGVLPMGASPEYFAANCWRNAQYLPFYVVHGNRGPGGDHLRTRFTDWVQRGYPVLWVDYKGRGVEWFSGELPNMFDWMRTKRRAFPLPHLGSGTGNQFGNELCTMRPNNHFYWLSSDDIAPFNLNNFSRWRLGVQPAWMHAHIDLPNNDVWVSTSGGVKKVTIWLGRDSKGRNMIDFDRKLMVRHNFNQGWRFRQTVTPSLSVLLEDLYQRGDRQHLFLARIELPPPKK